MHNGARYFYSAREQIAFVNEAIGWNHEKEETSSGRQTNKSEGTPSGRQTVARLKSPMGRPRQVEPEGKGPANLNPFTGEVHSAPPVVTVTQHYPKMLSKLTHAALLAFRDDVQYARTNGQQVNWTSLMTEAQREDITVRFSTESDADGVTWLADTEDIRAGEAEWRLWSFDDFIERALLVYPTQEANSMGDLEARARGINIKFSFEGVNEFLQKQAELLNRSRAIADAEAIIVGEVLRTFKTGRGDNHAKGWAEKVYSGKLMKGGPPKNLYVIRQRWDQFRKEMQSHTQNLSYYQVPPTGGASSGQSSAGTVARAPRTNTISPTRNSGGDSSGPRQRTEKKGKKEKPPLLTQYEGDPKDDPCYGCGRPGHTRVNCQICVGRHPDANFTSQPWANSPNGRAWKAKGKDTCPFREALNGEPVNLLFGGKAAKPKGKLPNYVLSAVHAPNDRSYTATGLIVICNTPVVIHVLIDTGCIFQANLISVDLSDKLRDLACTALEKATDREGSRRYMCRNLNRCTTVGLAKCSACMKVRKGSRDLTYDFSTEFLDTEHTFIPTTETICSGMLDTECQQTQGSHTFNLRLFDDGKEATIAATPDAHLHQIVSQVLPIRYDMIVRRQDAETHELFDRLPHHFRRKAYKSDYTALSSLHGDAESVITTEGISISHAQLMLNAIYSKDEFLDPVYDDQGLGMPDRDVEFPWEQTLANSTEGPTVPVIEGSGELQAQLRSLVHEFREIFRTDVTTQPALFEPMTVEVDVTKWHTTANRLPPRVQTHAKNEAIQQQVTTMLELNVIRPSKAAYYSQVHMVPKPNGKLRMTIDYRRLNDCTRSEGWPIPNIAQTLERIGARRPRFFAVMDLTSGYHQAPLAKASQVFTAFITAYGLYEWVRVPMGLKTAPSYFQKEMTEMLAGLLYAICEVYLDDVIVDGPTERQFVDNLRRVFERFRRKGVTLNPAKCRFGLQQIEYVGHTIDQFGKTFSREKLADALNFPKPGTAQEMKRFLGFVNYFRDHVRDISTLVQPLQKMVEGKYMKHKRLTWTPVLEERFEATRVAVAGCTKLWFMNPTLPIFLHTDASDYGVGAYLFQKGKDESGNEVELPIAFVSKSLTREQLNWSVFEKEAYAIVHACRKLEYLLRDVHFTLRTDHRNLTYINSAGSPKVHRWKLELQELNFDIEYVTGEENGVADGCSRLCARESAGANAVLSTLEGDRKLSRPMYNLIQKYHNRVAGHFGVRKTLEMMSKDKAKATEEDVTTFIRQCPTCQKLDARTHEVHAQPFTTATYEVMQTLNVDTIGPFPKDTKGNEYILQIIDTFTRFTELYAVPDTTALQAAYCLLDHIGRYGAPKFLRSDRGSQFVNEVIAELLRLVGTEHQLTLAYSKEENALVERANKEVNRHIRALTLEGRIRPQWSTFLPLVQRIMNASTHSATGFTPAQLVFGDAITLDRGIIISQDTGNSGKKYNSTTEWYADMRQAQTILIEEAKKAQKERDIYHMVNSDPHRTEFAVGSYVLVLYRTQPPTKLHTHWAGPMRVVHRAKNTYTLQDLITTETRDFHVTQLKQFVYDEMEVDPVDIARQDKEEFAVEKVINHRGDPKGSRKGLEFLVRWAGLDTDEDSWEPWEEMRNNAQCHLYLYQTKGLGHLLTKTQKDEAKASLTQMST